MEQNIFLEESNIPYYRITSLNYNLSIFKPLKMNKSTVEEEWASYLDEVSSTQWILNSDHRNLGVFPYKHAYKYRLILII